MKEFTKTVKKMYNKNKHLTTIAINNVTIEYKYMMKMEL